MRCPETPAALLQPARRTVFGGASAIHNEVSRQGRAADFLKECLVDAMDLGGLDEQCIICPCLKARRGAMQSPTLSTLAEPRPIAKATGNSGFCGENCTRIGLLYIIFGRKIRSPRAEARAAAANF